MNIKEFFADNLGKEYQGILSDIFDDREMRSQPEPNGTITLSNLVLSKLDTV